MTAAHPAGNALRRALAVLREEGLASFGFRLASTLGYRRLLLLECSLTQTVPQLESKLPLRFGILKAREVDEHLAFRPEMARGRVLDRLRSAQACFVARHEGRIVAACWTAMQPAWIEFLSCEFAVAAGEVYLFDAFTLPAYRGLGVAPALCTHQLTHFRQLGLRRAIRATLPENTAALRAHAKAGFRSYTLIRRIKIGPWQWLIQRPGRRMAACRTSDAVRGS